VATSKYTVSQVGLILLQVAVQPHRKKMWLTRFLYLEGAHWLSRQYTSRYGQSDLRWHE
jgi:hypothetical protein